jgi:large subunit ribosomal protein L21
MFAIVRTGGKQYRVAAGDKIVVEKLAGDAGDTITLGDVLLAGDGGELRSTDGLTVAAEIVAQAKGEKVIVFKKRRRHNYRRKKGHRQQHTILRITAIGDHKAEERAPAAAAAPAPAAAAAPAPAAAAAPAPAAAETAPAAEAPKKAKAKKADAAPAASEPLVDGGAEAPASTDLQPQPPLKVDGAESQMTDSPVATKKKASTKKSDSDTNA